MKPLVIFDIDGTLFETDSVWVPAIRKAQEEFGIRPWASDEITACFGDPPDAIMPGLAGDASPEVVERFKKRVAEIGVPLVSKQGKLYEGVGTMLGELRSRNFPMAVCTNGGKEYAEHILKSLGIQDFFEHVSSGAEHGGDKSKVVADLLTNYPCGVMAGDRVNDIQVARKNHIPCIGVSYGFGGKEIAKADFVADNPLQIITFVLLIQIFTEIEQKLADRRIVGIDGPDTSGKTTFALNLEKYLKSRGYQTQVIHLDDFHNPRSVRTRGADPVQGYLDNAFDLKLLEEALLAPAKRGDEVDETLTLLDLDTDQFTNRKRFRMGTNTKVILEGVGLYRPPIDQYFDVRVFLDAPPSQVLDRAEKRDGRRFGQDVRARYLERYIPAHRRYREIHKPRERSHLVVDATDASRPVFK